MTPFGTPMHDSPFGRGKARKSPRQRKPRIDREHAEAVALMKLVELHKARLPALRWLFAVPNGGWRGKPRKLRNATLPPTAACKAKAEGVRPGVPDYLWPQRSGSYVGLALELKAPKPHGDGPTTEQRKWLAHLEAQGWRRVVAYGAEEAWAAIREYCDGLPSV